MESTCILTNTGKEIPQREKQKKKLQSSSDINLRASCTTAYKTRNLIFADLCMPFTIMHEIELTEKHNSKKATSTLASRPYLHPCGLPHTESLANGCSAWNSSRDNHAYPEHSEKKHITIRRYRTQTYSWLALRKQYHRTEWDRLTQHYSFCEATSWHPQQEQLCL